MLSKKRIRQGLEAAGFCGGRPLLVHSSLRNIGPIDGGAEGMIEALRTAVGPKGTLAMPTFNGTRAIAQPFFDIQRTPGVTGALSETFRKQEGVIRSYHPTHSVAAYGPQAEEFLADHYLTEAFGIGSPIDRLAEAGGFVLLMGVSHSANSCIHIGEAHAGIVKFFWHEGELPVAPIRLPDGTIRSHLLDCSSSCSSAFNVLEYPLRSKGAIADLQLGRGLCYLMRCMDVIHATVRVISESPLLLLCTRSACRPCSMRRSHLIRMRAELPWTASKND